MKANEFVNRFGLDKAKEFSKITIKGISQEYCFEINTGDSIGLAYVDLNDLKRLVESHDLVESCGGLESVREKLTHGLYESRAVIERLKQAIADVEDCQWI